MNDSLLEIAILRLNCATVELGIHGRVVNCAGASIDVPLAHKDALYVRSHYDGVSITLPPETPDPDEIVLLVSVASRGRLNARVGGLGADTISGKDGLR